MKALINNITISYHLRGNPQQMPVIFIHGFPFSQKMWQPQVDALKNNYYVITYDVRGHGESGTSDCQYSIELFVDDLISLLDYCKLTKVIIAGLSMGGYIALRAIERHPERFSGIILCDTKSEADSNENKINRGRQIETIKMKGLPFFTEGFLKAAFSETTFHTNPHAVSLIKEIILNNTPCGITGTLLALAARTDTTASLARIQVPALILVGEQDTITPPFVARTMNEQIRNSEFHVVPGAAHMSNIENVKGFNRHLLAFLSKLG